MSRDFRSGAVRPRHASGMTLVELMFAVSILGLVLLIVTTLLVSSSRQQSQTVQRAEVQSGSRQTLSLMASELRQAGADPSNPPVGIVGIVAADSTAVHIRADLNGDGVIQTAEPSEDVTYAWNDTTRTVTRNPGSGPATLMENVTSMRLSYFDTNNQPVVPVPLSAADAARVHAIGLTITSEDRASKPITLTTRITLRNM